MTALSLVLGADLFSATLSLGMARPALAVRVHLSALFALFHMLMLSLGTVGGAYLARTIERLGALGSEPLLLCANGAGLFGGAVLAIFGFCMVRAEHTEEGVLGGKLHGAEMILLAISVSCDALVVGLGMGLLVGSWLKMTMVLGTVIFVVSLAGLGLGGLIGRALARFASPIGGALLMVWGIWLMVKNIA